MKFLCDQDVYAATINFLKLLGHDVITASEIGCSRASDMELLFKAKQLNRILVTRDRDFGELVFLENLGQGVIYLRILHSTINVGHDELAKVLKYYTEEDLKTAFIVVEPGRHRFRKLPG